MNKVKAIETLSARELSRGYDPNSSWHSMYKQSPYVYVGGLDFRLTEGDIIAIFSQYGEIFDCNLVRDKDTGTSRGFCFIGYEDVRSTILAVENFNGTKILERTIRVDHVKDYRDPKEKETEKEAKKEQRKKDFGEKQSSSGRPHRDRS
eukprot:GCRY01003670.1.p1 GENE.GCRY01003670.1~~GCRY01003670.1.p1  ORF type:complete len:149 (+),score=15.70 GCRY01003670.1:155-601(+)